MIDEGKLLSTPESQQFLREVLVALDSLKEKALIAGAMRHKGNCCTVGAVCAKKGVKTYDMFVEDIAEILGISSKLADIIIFENDKFENGSESKEDRYARMREWVETRIIGEIE